MLWLTHIEQFKVTGYCVC